MCHSPDFSLRILKILNRCTVSSSLKCPRGSRTRGKYLYVKSAWMWDCCRYHVLYFHCMISRLAMCHSRVFSILILETLNKCIVLHSLKCARGCPTLGKYFHVKSSWMWDCCQSHVALFHCVVSRLVMCQSRVFSLGILETLNRCIASPSLKCSRGCLTPWKFIYVKSSWMRHCCRYHVVFCHCILSHLALFQSRVLSLEVLEILNRCIVLSSLKCSCRCPAWKCIYVKNPWCEINVDIR